MTTTKELMTCLQKMLDFAVTQHVKVDSNELAFWQTDG